MSDNYIHRIDHNNIVKGILEGKLIYAACLSCNGSGRENWNENGVDVRPGNSNDPNRENGNCETCNGLGYVVRVDNR
mgnify:CR=1 FL=1